MLHSERSYKKRRREYICVCKTQIFTKIREKNTDLWMFLLISALNTRKKREDRNTTKCTYNLLRSQIVRDCLLLGFVELVTKPPVSNRKWTVGLKLTFIICLTSSFISALKIKFREYFKKYFTWKKDFYMAKNACYKAPKHSMNPRG